MACLLAGRGTAAGLELREPVAGPVQRLNIPGHGVGCGCWAPQAVDPNPAIRQRDPPAPRHGEQVAGPVPWPCRVREARGVAGRRAGREHPVGVGPPRRNAVLPRRRHRGAAQNQQRPPGKPQRLALHRPRKRAQDHDSVAQQGQRQDRALEDGGFVRVRADALARAVLVGRALVPEPRHSARPGRPWRRLGRKRARNPHESAPVTRPEAVRRQAVRRQDPEHGLRDGLALLGQDGRGLGQELLGRASAKASVRAGAGVGARNAQLLKALGGRRGQWGPCSARVVKAKPPEAYPSGGLVGPWGPGPGLDELDELGLLGGRSKSGSRARPGTTTCRVSLGVTGVLSRRGGPGYARPSTSRGNRSIGRTGASSAPAAGGAPPCTRHRPLRPRAPGLPPCPAARPQTPGRARAPGQGPQTPPHAPSAHRTQDRVRAASARQRTQDGPVPAGSQTQTHPARPAGSGPPSAGAVVEGGGDAGTAKAQECRAPVPSESTLPFPTLPRLLISLDHALPPLRARLAYRHQRPYGHGTGSFGYPLPRPFPIGMFMPQAFYRMAVFFWAPIFWLRGTPPRPAVTPSGGTG